jgi:hypothetical protein
MRAGGRQVLGSLLLGITALATGCAFDESDSTDCVLGMGTKQSGFEQGINASTLGNSPRGLAQSFKLDEDLSLRRVQINLIAHKPTTTTLCCNVSISIQTDALNNASGDPSYPSGTLASAAAAQTMLAANVSEFDPAWYTFEFSASFTLTKYVNYWLVVTAGYPPANPGSSTEAIVIWNANGSQAYVGGTAKYMDGGAWIQTAFGTNLDFMFRVGC